MAQRESYFDVLTAALNDIAEHGYDSPERLTYWMRRLREAAETAAGSADILEDQLRENLGAIYKRLVDQGGALKLSPGVSRYTLERIRPALRGELDRAIMASADLIRLNKQQAVAKTLQRFAGWASSIPKGGAAELDKVKQKGEIRKALRSLPFEERRVIIDQSHKLTASINRIVAVDSGAIAAVWHSHWRQAGYDYRPDHKDRDDQVYLIRGSWADKAGLVKPGAAGYTDKITQPGEEVFCRCTYQYLFALRRLPEGMLTAKGRQALAEAKEKAAAL